MAEITDKSLVTQGTEMDIDVATKTMQLLVAGNLGNDGVRGRTFVSAVSDLWKSDNTYRVYPFPLRIVDGPLGTMIELLYGWEMADATSRNLLRGCGMAYRSSGASSTVTAQWAGFEMTGPLNGGASDQPYYMIGAMTTPTDFNYTDASNELVQIYGDASHGNFDYRSNAKFFVREQGDTYSYYDLMDAQGVSSLLPVRYLLPMMTSADANISASDATIAANTPYTGITVTWLAGTGFAAWANSTVYAANAVVSDGGRWYITPAGGTSSGTGVADDTGVTDWEAFTGERDVDGTYYAFNIIVEGNSATQIQIYEKIAYLLRQSSDIDENTGGHRGDIETGLDVTLVGGIFTCSLGMYIDNVQAAQQSDYRFVDVGGTERSIAFVPQFTVNCVDADGVATNFATGTRLYIYDSTNASELYNDTPGAVNNIAVDYTGSGSADILVKCIAVNGTTNASKMIKTTSSINDTNVSINIVQEDNTIYVDNLIDGSGVSGVAINANKIDIDITDANNTISFQEIYNWYQYYLSTSAGIADSNNLITAQTQVDYLLDASVQIKNNKTGYPLKITGANIVSDDVDPFLWVDTSGEAIFPQPQTVVAFSYGSGALTTAQNTALLNSSNNSNSIKAVTDQLTIESGRVKADILDQQYEGTETVQDYLRISRAVQVGESDGFGTDTEEFKSADGTKTRVTSTNDGTNRTNVTVDAT